jgi:hypothetical protein
MKARIPFNTLLTTLFPSSERYQVTPRVKCLMDSMDFTLVYIVTKLSTPWNTPVFFLEVNNYLNVANLNFMA